LTAPRTNADRLVEIGVEAEVAHPTHSGTYSVDSYGRPILLPGMAGVVANARVGDLVFPWAADHLEPGVSAGNSDPERHYALQFLACIGNTVRIVSGPAAGAVGRVTGKHAFVLVDFPQDALDLLAPGDRLLVRAYGQGLRLVDFDDVAARSCSPALLAGMGVETTADGRLRVRVTGEVPAYMMGAGLGMSSEWANCDVMFTRREIIASGSVESGWATSSRCTIRITASDGASARACARSASSPTAATAACPATAWASRPFSPGRGNGSSSSASSAPTSAIISP
jgi:hypothetical protein